MRRCLMLLMLLLLAGCGSGAAVNGPATGPTPQQALMAQPFTPAQRATLRIVSDQPLGEALHILLYRYQDGEEPWLAYREVTRQGAGWQVGSGGGIMIGPPDEAPRILDYSLVERGNSTHAVMFGVHHEATLSQLLFWFDDGTQALVEVTGATLLYAFEGREICGFLALDDDQRVLERAEGAPTAGCAPQPDLGILAPP